MKVIFYNRDFTSQIPLSHLKITVERYSHNMLGGPDTAYIKIDTSGDNWELTKLLRSPVEIYDGDGHLNWWGYVNRVNVPSGDIMVGLGLDNMSNYVAANYSVLDAGETAASSKATTTWVSDAASVQEYGQKEKLLTINNATAAQAEGARDTYLASNKYAPPEVELSGGNTAYVRVECYGWFKTLEWKFYANATTSNIATTSQIAAIIASAGQFFNGSLIENASGIDSNQYRDGTVNAKQQVTELMNAGTTNVRPLLARVDKDRYIHVYERQAEDPEYLMRSDGQLETLLGQTVRASYCINSSWVRIKDIPDTLGGLSAMRNFFIESAEYDAERDRCVYRPAGAFEPLRLAKYVKDNAPDLGSGGGYNSLPYYPPASTSGATSSVYYVHPLASGIGYYSSGITRTTASSTGTDNYYYLFTMAEAGFYLVTASFLSQLSSGNGAVLNTITVNSNSRFTYGRSISSDGDANEILDNTCIVSTVYYVAASGTVEITMSISSQPGATWVYKSVMNDRVGIWKLGTVST